MHDTHNAAIEVVRQRTCQKHGSERLSTKMTNCNTARNIELIIKTMQLVFNYYCNLSQFF